MKSIENLFFARTLAFVLLMLVVVLTAQAQEFSAEIRGRVIDIERGEALVGANVVVVGTNLGSATNLEGYYAVRAVPPGTYSVTAKYVGYRQLTKEVTVDANATVTLDFSLSVSAVRMDEVIVTGQGTGIERRKLASPVETISAREIASAPVTSIDQLLQGRVAGLSSFTSSGQAGSGGRIRTRGIRSTLSSQTPVIFVDGVRIDNQDNFRSYRGTGGQVSSSLADVLVMDAERVEIIKGGAAATLFGSDAANGVIQIFTKKGFAGVPRWTFSTLHGIDYPETRWVREKFTEEKVMKTGAFQQYTANVTGGTDAATYNLSGRMQSSDGVIEKNTSRLYSLNGGMRASLAEKLGLEFSAGFTNARYGGLYNNNAIASVLGSTEDSTIQSTPNPDSTLRIALLPDHRDLANRFTTGLTTRYTPMDFLSTRLTIGADYRKNEQRVFNPIEAANWTSTPGGQVARFDREYLQISLDLAATVSYPKEGDFTSTATVGLQGFREEDRQSQATGSNFPVPGTDDFDNASTVTATESNQQLFSGGFYLNENIGIFNRVFVDLGIRIDGNSAFGKDVGVQSYPKFGLAYNISEEPMWSEYLGFLTGIVNSVKARASYGVTGKFPPAFTRDQTFNAGRFLNVGTVTFGAPGNKDLKPEKTTTVEYGFDAGFLDDRIGLEVTYYEETTKDAILTYTLELTTGYATQNRNVGEIKNKGYEVALNATPISTPDVDWSIRFSYANLRNKVTDLGGAAEFNIGGFAFLPNRVVKNQPIGVWQITFLDPATGLVDLNLEKRVSHGKSPTPKHTGSISSTVTLFKDLRINVLGDYAFGHYVLNTGSVIRAASGLYPDVLKIPANYRPPVAAQPLFDRVTNVWVEKADWFKLREISARYQLPSQWYEPWGLRGLAVSLSVRNVFTITPVKEFDPELHGVRAGRSLDVGGINFFTISPPRETRLGVEVTL